MIESTPQLASIALPAALREGLVTPEPQQKLWSPALGALTDAAADLPIEAAPTPALTLDVAAMSENIAAMHAWVERHGVTLAPHGKTTMAPALWKWQLDEGAAAITVANEFQLRVARAHGIRRVIVANEMLSPTGLEWLAGELGDDFEVVCWVDSLEGVFRMSDALRRAGARRPLDVCVEAGTLGARGGTRSLAEADRIAAAVVASDTLRLCGVSGFEASVPGDGLEEKLPHVRELLRFVGEVFEALAPRFETTTPLLSVGGSAFFDLVVDALGPIAARHPGTTLVLRSGAYVIHDDGLYQIATPAATRTGPALRPSARVWSRVLSTPEPGLSLIDAGRRDVPYDVLLPTVLAVHRDGEALGEVAGLEVVRLDDQHAFVRGEGLRVGDVVVLGMSHPCTMFDKWGSALLVEDTDDGTRIRGVIPTFF